MKTLYLFQVFGAECQSISDKMPTLDDDGDLVTSDDSDFCLEVCDSIFDVLGIEQPGNKEIVKLEVDIKSAVIGKIVSQFVPNEPKAKKKKS